MKINNLIKTKYKKCMSDWMKVPCIQFVKGQFYADE